MLYSADASHHERGTDSIHDPYKAFSPSKQPEYRHQSDKNIKKKEQTQLAMRTQRNEEPFYFKLSNSNTNLLQRKIESKPELVNIQNMKKVLNHNYSSEISNKSQERRSLERKRIIQERDFLSHLHQHGEYQRKRLNKLKSDYNKNLNEQLNKKKIVMEINKGKEREVDLSYKPRQNSLVHKAESWKNFYEQAYSFRDNVAKEYNEYMTNERKYEHKRNKSELLNLFSDQKDYALHKQFERHMKQYQTQSLKSILEKQIAQKSKILTFQNACMKNLSYNPIVNPIDYKMDLNNKYVLKQISPKKFFL